jgi:hypothetical protein
MGHTKESLRQLLLNNDAAVERAIVAIWKRQTDSEKASEQTIVHNGVGFASCHARMGSYYADWVQKGRRLTGKHLHKARSMALRYTRQLLEIAESTQAARDLAKAARIATEVAQRAPAAPATSSRISQW